MELIGFASVTGSVPPVYREGVSVSRKLAVVAALMLGVPALSSASETVTYTYDAKGRLVKVEHTGTVNNGVKAEYSHDKAGNRTSVKVTGAP